MKSVGHLESHLKGECPLVGGCLKGKYVYIYIYIYLFRERCGGKGAGGHMKSVGHRESLGGGMF